MKINKNIITAAAFTIILINLIFNIILLVSNNKLKEDVKWDMRSIDRSLDDINESMDDIKNDIINIDYDVNKINNYLY